LKYPRRGEPFFSFRLPKLARFALEAEARRIGVSSSAFVRALVIASLTKRGENMGVSRSVIHRSFDRAVKRFMLAYQMPVGIAGLPAKEKRDELEELSWAAVQEAIKFAKAQEDPELRLAAMRVVGYLIRTELAIQHEQDQAAVDELYNGLEAARRELAEKVRASRRDKRGD
jgi:predicted DNA-binding protein (UPF0251 family)